MTPLDLFLDLIYESLVSLFEFLSTLDDFTLIKDSVNHFRSNIDDLISSFGLINTKLYKTLSNHLEKLISTNLKDLELVLGYYSNLMNKSLTISSKFQTIMIIAEVNTYIKAIFDKISLDELEFDNQIDLYQKLNKATKKKLMEYFNSWCLNLSNLIEENFKSCIFTLLIIRNLSNKIYPLFNYNVKDQSLWDIYQKFGINDEEFENLKYIRRYRNAISHPNFEFKFTKNWSTSSITFTGRRFSFDKTLKEIISDYIKIFKFVFTCNHLFMIFHLRCQNEGKPFHKIFQDDLFLIIDQSTNEIEKFKVDFEIILEEIKKNKDNLKLFLRNLNS